MDEPRTQDKDTTIKDKAQPMDVTTDDDTADDRAQPVIAERSRGVLGRYGRDLSVGEAVADAVAVVLVRAG